MPLSEQDRRRRRRRQNRRGMLLLGVVFLIFAAIIALVIWLAVLAVGALSEKNPAPEGTIPAPTTTYPALDSAQVAPLMHMGSVLLYDVTHDRVLYEQNADIGIYPASTTKLMTALAACGYGNMHASYVIGSEQALVDWDASRAYLEEGKTYSMAAMLDALLLPSGADAAYCLAVNVARHYEKNPNLEDAAAVEAFVGYMNAMAVELGCVNTHFVTPDGYHDDAHYTTPRDMLKIARAALDVDVIAQIVRRSESDYGDWTNGNLLVCPDEPYYYADAIGLKTGYTDEAGFCLAAAAERNGVRLIAVMFKSTSTEYRFIDAQLLFEQGFALAENPPTTATPRLFNYFDLATASTTAPSADSPAA